MPHEKPAPVFVEPTDDELRQLESWLTNQLGYARSVRMKRYLTLAAQIVSQYRRRFRPCD